MKLFSAKTDSGLYKIIGISVKDIKEYVKDKRLYDKKITFSVKLVRKVKSEENNIKHITDLAKIALKYDDSKVSKEGVIKIISDKIETKTVKEVDKQRDAIFDAMDDSKISTVKFDNIF